MNPDNLPVSVYKRMHETDETVRAAVRFIQLTVFDQLDCFEHPSSRVTSYLNEFWDRCRTGYPEAVTETTDAIWAGFSVQEIVPKYEDGKIWLKEFPALDQVDCRFHMDMDPKSDRYGCVSGVSQDFGLIIPGKPIIDADRLAIFSHNSKNGNPYGLSNCKSIYKHWVQKDVMIHAGGAGMERYGLPFALGLCEDPAAKVQDRNGTETTEGAQMLKALQSLATLGVIVLKKDKQDVRLIEPANQIAEQFKVASDQCNKLIMRGMLLPSLMMEPTDIGSFALGSKHFELFLKGVRDLVMAVRSFYAALYRRFIAWNFGPDQAKLGSWRDRDIDENKAKVWAEIAFSAFASGYLREDKLEDINFARARIGADSMAELMPPREKPAPAAAPPTSGVTDPTPQPSPDAKPGNPRSNPKTPAKPQGRPAGKR